MATKISLSQKKLASSRRPEKKVAKPVWKSHSDKDPQILADSCGWVTNETWVGYGVSFSDLESQYRKIEKFQIKKDTMLLKLSKYEVKVWLCWNLIMLPPLQFCMKSNFGEIKWSKNVIFGNFRGSEFWFLVNLSNF